jgi:hypothetical protein
MRVNFMDCSGTLEFGWMGIGANDAREGADYPSLRRGGSIKPVREGPDAGQAGPGRPS